MPAAGSPVRARIEALDVVRGIAVGGILLANVFVFFLLLMPAETKAALPTAGVDRQVERLMHVFVEGKFYSVFSLLFGIGFGLQLSRGGEAAMPRFRRRLRILLAIGAVHAFLVWAGDILMLYALLGFAMPRFARASDRTLLRWTIGLLAAPTALYLVALAAWLVFGSQSAATSREAALPADLFARVAAMGTGGFGDAFVGNLVLLVGRWVDLVATVRPPKVLGMFVLGLWLVRSGIVADPVAHAAFLRRWRAIGWSVGLPANILAAIAFLHWPYLPPGLGGLVGVASQAIGVPLLAIGYAATITLAVAAGSRAVAVFAPVGRMALTNYLSHSIVCVTLSYGFGLGLWWRIGPAVAWLIALGILAIQIPCSRWWLARYQYGPMEWVWRRLTYGQPLPMRRGATARGGTSPDT